MPVRAVPLLSYKRQLLRLPTDPPPVAPSVIGYEDIDAPVASPVKAIVPSVTPDPGVIAFVVGVTVVFTPPVLFTV